MRAVVVLLIGAAVVVAACGTTASPAASESTSPRVASPSLDVTSSPSPQATTAAPTATPTAVPTAVPTAPPTSPSTPTPTRVATPPPTPVPAASVIYQNFTANPATLQVGIGTRVTWTNRDAATHTVTSGANRQANGTFNGTVGPGASFSFVFGAAGTFEYFCSIHSTMSGFRIVAR